MKYITACVTEDYWPRTKPWLDSVAKFAEPQGFQIICFTVDFDGGAQCKRINRADIPNHEQPGWCENRKDYLKLEGGEFLHFYDFKDDDFVINSDVDMIMQREMAKEEMSWLENLGRQMIAITPEGNPKIDLFDPKYISTPELRRAFSEKENAQYWVHNCGIMAGYVSAWKRLRSAFRCGYPIIRHIVPHHAIGQWAINYILQADDSLVPLPRGFHEAPWWAGCEHIVKRKGDTWHWKDKEVCFFHHKFRKEFGFDKRQIAYN